MFATSDPPETGSEMFIVRWAADASVWNFNVETNRIPAHIQPLEKSDAELSAAGPIDAQLYGRRRVVPSECACDSNGVCAPCAQQAEEPWVLAGEDSPFARRVVARELRWRRGVFAIVSEDTTQVEVRHVAWSAELPPSLAEVRYDAESGFEWMYQLPNDIPRVDAVTGETLRDLECRAQGGDGFEYSEWNCTRSPQ